MGATLPAMPQAANAADMSEARELTHPKSFRAQRLLKSLNRFLLNRQPAKAAQVFHDVMRSRFHDSGRARMFVGTINVFLRRGHMREAMQIYSYMVEEGFIPEPKLKAVMLVFRRIAARNTGQVIHASTLLTAIEPVLADKEFDEACLRFLLVKIYQSFKIQLPMLVRIAELYLQVQPSGTKLASGTINVLRQLSARLSMTDQPAFSDLRATVGRDEPRVDAAALLTFAQRTAAGPRASSALLRHVFKEDAPSSSGVRILLAFFAKNRCYDWATEMYQFLGTMGGNAYTWKSFSIMFSVIRIFSRQRSIRQRGVRKPYNLPSLHDVFRDMLASHLAYTKNRPKKGSTVMNGAILCRALHAFIWQEDYAAAFIALGTFRICDLPVTIDAYRNTLGGLVDRLQFEAPFIDLEHNPSQWYAYRFFGSMDSANIPTALDLVNAVLTVGEESRINLDPIPLKEPVAPEREDQFETVSKAAGASSEAETSDTPADPNPTSTTSRRRRYHAMPTAFELLGIAPPSRPKYSAVPLQRILRRAMLAVPQQIFETPSTYTTSLAKELKRTMVPPMALSRALHKPKVRFQRP